MVITGRLMSTLAPKPLWMGFSQDRSAASASITINIFLPITRPLALQTKAAKRHGKYYHYQKKLQFSTLIIICFAESAMLWGAFSGFFIEIVAKKRDQPGGRALRRVPAAGARAQTV
jgi:hypothetical protein